MRRNPLVAPFLGVLALAFATPSAVRAAEGTGNCAATSTGLVPLTDLVGGTYLGESGGLYPGGSNEPTGVHESRGQAAATQVLPRNALGLPSLLPPSVPVLGGRIVLLTIGMSNTNAESQRLVQLANSDPLRNPAVTIVNGAQGGQDAQKTKDPQSSYWSYVDQQLVANNVTAAQVQVVWLKQAIAGENRAFPGDANALRDALRSIIGILDTKFPNLQLVFTSSRIYAGYATTSLNPEPHAYHSGFAVKWLIGEQIDGTSLQTAPWVGWGPYLWADGLVPRSDGLVWNCSDLAADGTHPSPAGAMKVGQMVLSFLHESPLARGWYLVD